MNRRGAMRRRVHQEIIHNYNLYDLLKSLILEYLNLPNPWKIRVFKTDFCKNLIQKYDGLPSLVKTV